MTLKRKPYQSGERNLGANVKHPPPRAPAIRDGPLEEQERAPDYTLGFILAGILAAVLCLLVMAFAIRAIRGTRGIGTGSGSGSEIAYSETSPKGTATGGAAARSSGDTKTVGTRDGRQDEVQGVSGSPEPAPSSEPRSSAPQDDEHGDTKGNVAVRDKTLPSFRTFDGVKTSPNSRGGPSDAPGVGDGDIEFFGVEGSGSEIVYVIDMSGSMVGYRIHRAKKELLESIWRLHRDQYFCVLFFHSSMVAPYGVKLSRADFASKKEIRNSLSNIQAFDGTDPTEAVEVAIGLSPDVVYLLSDGEFPPGTVERISQMNRSSRLVINTIGFQIDAASLRQIAADNRGEYKYVP